MSEIPVNLLPMLTWPWFFYKQQLEYYFSDTWQTWLIGGNGTGKSLLVYTTLALHMYGIHPKSLGEPPIKIKVLVPSFDYVKDVALEKLTENQRIIFTNLNPQQAQWVEMLKKTGIIINYREPDGDVEGALELPPLIPGDDIAVDYSREHKGLELKNGSSIWFVTSEQGWRFQRGGECDILSCDEEGDERVWDELKRGLRNAKGGGKIYAGMTPPYEEGQGPTWTKEKILEASVTDPSIHVVNACMADNPAITPAFIEEFKKGKTQKQIDVQIYGLYPTWGDLVHPHFQDSIWDYKKKEGHLLENDTPLPRNNDVDWVMAFDWHDSKPCAAIFGYFDRGNNLTIFDELDKQIAEDLEVSEVADLFRRIEGNPVDYRRNLPVRKYTRWQDPSAKHKSNIIKRGQSAWAEFAKCGIVTRSGQNRDPSFGISIVNEYFKGNGKDHPRIFIYERCHNLRRYLKNHYWKRGEDGIGKPDAKWSDYPICLRYIIQDEGTKRRGRRPGRWPLQSFKKHKEQRRTYDLGMYI